MMEGVEDITCPICCDLYNSTARLPKCLPCNHTVCLQCLEKMTEFRLWLITRQITKQVTCPFCRAEHELTTKPSLLPNKQATLDLLQLKYREKVNYAGEKLTNYSQKLTETEQAYKKAIRGSGRKANRYVNGMISDLKGTLGRCEFDIWNDIEDKKARIMIIFMTKAFKKISKLQKKWRIIINQNIIEEAECDAFQASVEKLCQADQSTGDSSPPSDLFTIGLLASSWLDSQDIKLRAGPVMCSLIIILSFILLWILMFSQPGSLQLFPRARHHRGMSPIATIGSPDKGPKHFKDISGIAGTLNNTVIVTDKKQGSVREFSLTGTMLRRIKSPEGGAGMFRGLGGVAVDLDGSIFIVTEHNVHVFSNTGTFRYKFEGCKLDSAYGIAIDEELGLVYVVDTNSGSVIVYLVSGICIRRFGESTLDLPLGIAVYQDSIFVTDMGLNKIIQFNKYGRVVNAIGEVGQFQTPTGIVVDLSTNVCLIVCDVDNHRLQVIDHNTGAPIAVVGSKGDGLGKFKYPVGVALMPYGHMVVAEQLRRLHIFK